MYNKEGRAYKMELPMFTVLRLIALAILFLVIWMVWQVGRWTTILPYPLLEIFPNLPPMPFWNAIYGVFVGCMNSLAEAIIIIVALLYLLYRLIRDNAPEVFGIKDMCLAPFGPFIESGVFPLLDCLWGVIFSWMPISQRIKETGTGIGSFLTRGILWAQYQVFNKSPPPWVLSVVDGGAEMLGDGQCTTNKRNTTVQHTSAPAAEQDTGMTLPTPVEELPPPPVKKPSSSMTPETEALLNDTYRKCLEEKVVEVDVNANGFQRALAQIKNSNASVECSVQKFKIYNNELKWRLEKLDE